MAALLTKLSDMFSPNKRSALTALQEVESAIDAIERQKETIEAQLLATQTDLEEMKNFREMHSEKVATWKKQDELGNKLRQSTLNTQITVAAWSDYKAALGELLIRNAAKPMKELRVYFLGEVPDETRLKKIIPGYAAYGVQTWSLADTENPVQVLLHSE
jgi:hypothetical protein